MYFEQDWFFISEVPRSTASVASLIKQQQQEQQEQQKEQHQTLHQQQQLPKPSNRHHASSSLSYTGSDEDEQASALFQRESLKYKKTSIQLTTLPYASTDAEPGQPALGPLSNLTSQPPSLISSPKSNFGATSPAAATKKPGTGSGNPQSDFKVSSQGVWELKVRRFEKWCDQC